ncbi:radical SAM family heme chaperone HemW [Tropicimonas sp.]|uniref:radical SAM family heme chaperone HemW n=1 Tax=Tropicimonas sp. TaxID=2067044 RepID=UPI003A8964CE
MPSPGLSRAALSAESERPGFGLYLHWPFCQSKCPYCDFNSHVSAAIDQTRWADAYAREIARAGVETAGRRLDTVFFGGGTPSLMAPETVQKILDTVRATWNVANDWEVTLEANPGSVDVARFAAYRQAGVNRVSLGIQSLNDGDLRRLGRLHSAEEARRAFEIARTTFDRVSFDLIYARQDQSLADWRAELDAALELAADHLSLYQLTIEPGTAFGARFAAGGLRGLPDEDLSADLYELTVDRAAARGLLQYEISNFARPGYESRHNMLYWSAGDYIGIGPGAHGRLTLSGHRFATVAPASPADWLLRVESGQGEVEHREILDSFDQVGEYLMMGLRVRDGISLLRLENMGADKRLAVRISELEKGGFLHIAGGRVLTTDRGRALLNALLVELLPG